MAAIHIAQEGLWLCSLFTELHLSFPPSILVYLDNSGAITLLTVAKFSQCSKHINIYPHFIHKHVDNGSFTLIWILSHHNITNIFTKALGLVAQ